LAVAAGLALVSFSSLMLTGRSFALKNGYDIDPDQDFAALGTAEGGVFEAEYRSRIGAAYPREADGKTLFPFRRLFIVARV